MQTLKEYLLKSQFHGLRFIATEGNHWLERLFWFFCVIISWVLSILVIKDYWQSFTTNPLSFVTETDYANWNTSFFSMSVCEDKNDVTILKLAKSLFGKNFNNSNNMQEVLLEIAHFRGTGAFLNKVCIEMQRDCPVTGLKELAITARSPCDGLFHSCFWMEEEFNCCEYFMPMETEIGLCYSINSIQTRKKNYFKAVMNKRSDVGSMRIVLMLPSNVYVHAPEDVPYLNTVEFLVQSSTADLYKRYLFRVLETVNDPLVRDVTVEQRQCRYPEENPLWIYESYSYSACIVQCRMERQITLCNCSSHLTNFTRKPCDLEGLMCLQKHMSQFLPLTLDGLTCDCLPGCNEPQYDHLNYETYGGLGETAEIEVGLIALPTAKLRRQVVRGVLDLVVSVGGSAGLFVGASMLSFVEVFYFFTIRMIWNRVVKKREEQRLLVDDPKYTIRNK